MGIFDLFGISGFSKASEEMRSNNLIAQHMLLKQFRATNYKVNWTEERRELEYDLLVKHKVLKLAKSSSFRKDAAKQMFLNFNLDDLLDEAL